MDNEIIVMWRNEKGLFSHDPPGRKVASTISEAALRNLAETHRVFVLELSEDGEDIGVTKL